MNEHKKIDLDKAREILTHLDEVPNPIVSARQFVILNFDTLQQSGKTLKALYDFLTSKRIDVGTFESFRAAYNSVKRARSIDATKPALPERAAEPEKALPPVKIAPVKPEKAKNGESVKDRPPGLGLRPIYLADGTEVTINPETGAKHFKI
jgi:hypothetical protein